MYTWIQKYIYVHKYTDICTHRYINICTQVHIYMYTWIHKYMYVHKYLHGRICTSEDALHWNSCRSCAATMATSAEWTTGYYGSPKMLRVVVGEDLLFGELQAGQHEARGVLRKDGRTVADLKTFSFGGR
eukprot:GHVS01067311.1.p2 GENE.GHVS01067311.1~~GHVS01067311.1.p2  ORF type:complete len:130 (-),score=6.29 GHVS01067311.1:251-640(-)